MIKIKNIGLNHRINQYFSLGIFICTFLYIYFALCYIVYDIFTISPMFLWTKDFFFQHVTHPFIFTNYISLFFIQFFTTRFAGALILSFLATLFFIVFRKILNLHLPLPALLPNLFSFIPLLFLLYLLNTLAIENITNLILIGICSILISKIRNTKFFPLWFIFIEFFLWWCAQPHFILFLIWNLGYILQNRKNNREILFSALYLLFAILLYTGNHFLPNSSPALSQWAFLKRFYSSEFILFFIIVAIIPVLEPLLNSLKKIKIIQYTSLCILFILLVFNGLKVNSKKNQNSEAIIKYKFENENWKDLIHYAIKQDFLSQTATICTNYALYKEGRLLDSMFKILQNYSGHGLLAQYHFYEPDDNVALNFFYNKNAILLGKIYFELGLHTCVQRIAVDFLARYGNQPQALMLLINNHLAYGEIEAARKYISILEKNPFYKKQVKKFQELAKDSVKKQLTSYEIIEASLASYPSINLELILESDEKNEMAFEYYIAYCLLYKDLSKLSYIVDKLIERGFKTMPENFEICTYINNAFYNNPINLKDLKRNLDLHEQFLTFFRKLMNTPNKEIAKKELRSYQGSYMYYFIFTEVNLLVDVSSQSSPDHFN